MAATRRKLGRCLRSDAGRGGRQTAYSTAPDVRIIGNTGRCPITQAQSIGGHAADAGGILTCMSQFILTKRK